MAIAIETHIRLVDLGDDAAVRSCFPVMQQLRPALGESDFVAQIVRQRSQGFQLARLEQAARVQAVAGFRMAESLAWGRYLYVDDLVTDAASRSRGHGATLLAWLVAHAREHGCASFQLDSGVQRFAAHRFYLRHGLEIRSHHFGLNLADPLPPTDAGR